MAIGSGTARAQPCRSNKGEASNAHWQDNLAIAHERVGGALMTQGDRQGGLQSYRTGLAIMERLTQADPVNAQWRMNVLLVNSSLANAGDDTARRQAFAAATIRQLTAADELSAEQAQLLRTVEAGLTKFYAHFGKQRYTLGP
jgi:hypothetical protein